MPTVINRHHYDSKSWPQPSVYVGRGHPLGNPFEVEKHGRERALELYRDWLGERLAFGDEHIVRALLSIRAEHYLVCSCAPKPCHADVIVEEWKREKGIR